MSIWKGFFVEKASEVTTQIMKRPFFLLFLRAKEKNSTLPEMFFQTQKLTKTYMFNKVSSYSKTKLSDTDSTRTKDCLISANFSREKIVSAVILFKLVFEETLVLEGGGGGGGGEGGGRKKRKPKNPTGFSRRKESLTIQV